MNSKHHRNIDIGDILLSGPMFCSFHLFSKIYFLAFHYSMAKSISIKWIRFNLLLYWYVCIVSCLMPGSHRTAVTILCAHVAFWVYGLENDTLRNITVAKGVERCRTVWEIGHGLNSIYFLFFHYFSRGVRGCWMLCKPYQTVLKLIYPCTYVTLTDVSSCIDWHTVT